MFKRYGVNIVFGLIGGLLGTFLTLNFVGSDIVLSSNKFNDELKSQIVSSLPTPSASPLDYWQDVVRKADLSTVAIQVFSNNRLLREVSGIVLSSDGIVITTYEAITNAETIQVFSNDKIYRGEVVVFDKLLGLALLKVSGDYSSVADLSPRGSITSGNEVILVGKIIDSNKPLTFSQKGIVSYVSDRSILIDTKAQALIQGSEIIDADGNLIGMAFIKNNKVYLATNEILNTFLFSYLDTLSQ